MLLSSTAESAAIHWYDTMFAGTPLITVLHVATSALPAGHVGLRCARRRKRRPTMGKRTVSAGAFAASITATTLRRSTTSPWWACISGRW